jgi:hypothetical protein
MRATPTNVTRVPEDAGFVLPLTLLLLAALTALALAFQALAEADRKILGWDREALQRSIGPVHETHSLGFGYALVSRGSVQGGDLSLIWTLDPGRASEELWDPRGPIPEGPIQQDESGGMTGLGPLSVSGWIGLLPPDPALEPSFGDDDVAPATATFGGVHATAMGLRVLQHEGGPPLLLAPFDLSLSGTGPFSGVVLAGAWITVAAEVVWIGGGRAKGISTQPAGSLSFVPDPGQVEGALRLLQQLTGVHELVPEGGARVGRWVP